MWRFQVAAHWIATYYICFLQNNTFWRSLIYRFAEVANYSGWKYAKRTLFDTSAKPFSQLDLSLLDKLPSDMKKT